MDPRLANQPDFVDLGKIVKPAPAPATETAPRLGQLTSLRFFAALAVLSSHLWVLEEEPNILQPLARSIFHEGYAGVSFFFMLSGFILSHTYQRKLVGGSIKSSAYFMLRLIRIYPLHFLTALPFALWALAGGGLDAAPRIIANLSLVQSWVPIKDYYFSLNDPSWSLSDEIFFYGAFAGLARFPTRRLTLFAMALLAAAVAIVWLLIAHHHASWSVGDGDVGFPHWLTYINPAVRLLDFVVGMLLYRFPKPRLSRSLWTAGEAVSVLALIVAAYAFTRLDLPQVLRAQLLYLPLMALVIYVFAAGGGLLSKWLCNERLVLLGDASFALYMIHLPILNGTRALFEQLGEPIPLVAYAAGAAGLSVGLSIVTFRFVERPIHTRLKRLVA